MWGNAGWRDGQTWETVIAVNAMPDIMLGLHYVPGRYGGHVCPKRSAPWDFSPLSIFVRSCYVFKRPLTVSGTGRDGSQVVDSRRLKGAVRFGPFGPRSITDASTLPPGPPWCDGVPRVSHVLIKDWDVFHVLSRLSADETWTLDSFGARLSISCLLINLKDQFWCLILHLRGQGIC